MVVEGDQTHIEREAASANQALEVFERRRLLPSLNPGDCRLRRADEFSKRSLTEPCAAPSFADQVASIHLSKYSK
jgi:hypothetical protein